MSTPAISSGRPLPRVPANNKPFDGIEFKKCQSNATQISTLISKNQVFLKNRPDILELESFCNRIVTNRTVTDRAGINVEEGKHICEDPTVRVLLSTSLITLKGLVSTKDAIEARKLQ